MKRLTRHLTPALAAVAVLGGAGVAAAAPNLQPFLDNDPESANPLATHNWFVETTAAPYSAHYFYGATVKNTSATDALKITARPGTTVGDTATAQQVIGATTTDLDPAKMAITSIGAPNPGFTNWGVSNLFSIALTPSGGAAIPGGRTVFCWASTSFPSPQCNTTNELADGVDMGISPGESDSVAVGTTGAYFDITGVAPGTGTVVETVDPKGALDEGGATGDNSTLPVAIQIPGVSVQGAAASTTDGKPVSVPLAGTIEARDVLGTPAGGTPAPATGALTYAATNGAHGTVSVAGASAAYTPAPGFVGDDSFTYTATDSRGLQSRPATVTVRVGAAVPSPPVTLPPAAGKVTLTLKPAYVVQRRGGKTWLRIRGTLPRSQAGRIVIVQRKIGKKVRTLAKIRVAKNGTFVKLVRVSGKTITVRTRIGSSATAKAATSPFKRVVIVRSRR